MSLEVCAATLRVADADACQAAAAVLGPLLAAGDCVELSGELGSGKTTFTRGLCRGRGVPEEQVASPSFSILHSYEDAAGTPVLHVDGFRLRSEGEVDLLGLEEAGGAVLVVEWADRVARALPADRLRVELQDGEFPQQRMLEVTTAGVRSRRLLATWLAGVAGRPGVEVVRTRG